MRSLDAAEAIEHVEALHLQEVQDVDENPVLRELVPFAPVDIYKTREFTKGNFGGGAKLGCAWNSYEAAVFARNITNEKNLKGVIENYRAGVYNDPRTIGISLSRDQIGHALRLIEGRGERGRRYPLAAMRPSARHTSR